MVCLVSKHSEPVPSNYILSKYLQKNKTNLWILKIRQTAAAAWWELIDRHLSRKPIYSKSMTWVRVKIYRNTAKYLIKRFSVRIKIYTTINISEIGSANEAYPRLSDRLSTGRQKPWTEVGVGKKIERGAEGDVTGAGVHRPSPSRVVRTSSVASSRE